MAQLKDLMVYGDAKFLANAMLDHDPTLNLEAATKHYVDQAVSGSPQGTVTSITLTQGTGISVSNSGTAITTSGTRTIALDQAFGTEFIVGTQTAATGSWTGVTKRAALYDGMQIAYWLPFAGSGNATLNLTLSGGGTTGAVNCYYNGTTRLTTHYGAGNLVHLTYRSNVNIGGTNYTGWWSNANYDTNDGHYYNRYVYSNSYTTGSVGVFAYTLLMERADGTLDSIVTSSTTATSKARNTNGFRLPRVLYWSNSSVAANTVLGTYYLYEAYTGLVDFRYSFNITTSGLTATKPIYLVGTMGNDGLFYLDATWWTQTLPTSNNGKLYIHIADAYDGYRGVLNYQKPIYKYINGLTQQWVSSAGYAASAGTAASATKATNDDSNHQISTYYAHTLTTSGNTIGLEDGNGDDISGSFITVPYATSAGSATSATNASTLLGGTSGQVLISNGTSGVWSTAPYQQIRVANATYNPNAGFYQGGTYNRYIRIKVPNQTIWYMCQLEVSLRGNYTAAEGGKIIINAYHGSNSPYTWTALNASVHGKLTNVAVYAADGQYFYIDYNFAYRTVSIDKMLVGDNAVNYDCSNIVVDAVDTLPSTYQTATMLWGINGSGLTSGYFVVGNSNSAVKISTMQPTTSSTTWSTTSDVNVPTMKAISSYVTGLGYTTNTGTVTSVGFSAGTGISLSGNTTINTSGTVTITNSGVVGIKIGGSSATAQTGTVIFNAFSGTDGDSAGTIGLVPAPPATTAKQFLTNQGTWGVISASDIPTLGYLPLTGGTLTPPANSGSRAPLVIDCSAMTSTAWTEGIRIKPATNGWTSIMLCGTDNTTTNNSSANSWSMHTYSGSFYLSRNGSNTANQQLTCASGLWTMKSDSTLTAAGILTVTSSAANANAHVLLDLLAPSLSAGSSGSYSTAWLRLGVALNTRNSGCLGFHYVGSGSTSNYLGIGLYAVDYVLNVVGTGRVGIKNTAPISELDVTGGISWSSKATSQYNSTDDCIEFIFV